MSHAYVAVGWNRQKKLIDLLLVLGVGLYLGVFLLVSALMHPQATAETLLIRSTGTASLLLLHLILAIGPWARLDRRALPLLYNRRHLGVTMFLLALVHGVLSLVQFHALGDRGPLVSMLTSDGSFGVPGDPPFQVFGFLALLILFLMAATSHDFWLANLSARTWKTLHMGVYLAYALLVAHLAFGALAQDGHAGWRLLPYALGLLTLVGLHLAAARREAAADAPVDPTASGMVPVCRLDEIPQDAARIVLAGEERVAVFRHEGGLSAVSNVCAHQGGPLGEGRIVDGCITCPWHGYQYLPDSGTSPPPFTEKLATFQVALDGEQVYVDPRPHAPGPRLEPAPVPTGEPATEEFYVGYAGKAPNGLATFLKPRVMAMLAGVVLAAGILSAGQAPFADATFDWGNPQSWQGRLLLDPYPQLVVDTPSCGPSRYLLCGMGKFGLPAVDTALAGHLVTLEGTLIARDQRVMLEVVPDSLALDPTPDPLSVPAGQPGEPLGEVTLRGEIVDGKCFLGVMKPGHGRTHRACAHRCLSGGIPALFVTATSSPLDADSTEHTYHLLSDSAGNPLPPDLLHAWAARPVEATGQLFRYDDLVQLRLATEGLRPLP
jgi:sulfoxide reductase heme-binding subunit YedZ